MPTVSIIIPTFNRGYLILDSLRSIFLQDYSDYEIIVVDDGSTDNTEEVLSSLIEDNKIRYVKQDNHGESSARNHGILLSQGKYIAFLDSDDLFEPTKLKVQVQYMEEHPEIGLVHSGYTKFDNYGHDLGYRDTSWFCGKIYPKLLLHWTVLMAVDTVMVPKKVFDAIGLFDESLRMGPDLDMWRRISRKYSFGFINESLARVRVHAGNISGDKLKATEGFIQYLEKAFEDAPDLSARFRRRVFSRMFSTQAYNLLSGSGDDFLQAARLNAVRAITYDFLNPHGFVAFLSTMFGYKFRNSLVQQWRLLRSRIMSRNRLI